MKFKRGDKVRILPSAMDGGVSKKAVGKIGEITKYSQYGGYFNVIICKGQDSGPDSHLTWCVYPDQIELVVVKGQQLLFSFMSEAT